ncbi:MAG: superoxide dismutase [Reyranella sp.]|uniref:superoxide dismutase n=1 Tax=Reyranella sp. TaxID=1929291 RepID=UPI00120D328B|nr:Fe-Mn family superoxide dismutase [Reyranella sp.]TAJ88740.1 MAG: superoxide dismutase [Reyranella sp.]TBR21416.1 MAG: superoxide dismutase [Reyranella sp.]
MTDISRRSLAAGAGLLVGAFAIGARAQQAPPQLASAVPVPKATPKPLIVNPDKVKGLSANLLRTHHDAEYAAGAVKRLNAIGEALAKIDFAEVSPEKLGELKRDEQAAQNAIVLHELYFDGLAEAPSQPSGLLAQALSRDFGSLDRWKAEFVGIGKSLPSGMGWVILAYAPRDKRLFNYRAENDSMAPAGGVPLLAMDMFEHAYAADYGTDIAKYIDAYVQAIKWTNAERLYREAMRV